MSFSLPSLESIPGYTVISGEKCLERGSGQKHAHIYPANGEVTRELLLAGPADVDEAVEAARKALPAWRALAGDQRRNLMLKMAEVIDRHAAELAALATLENGTPSMVAPYMAADAVQKFRYYAGWADKIQGLTVPTWAGPAHDYVSYEPYGVVGAIIPWNGPLFAATMVISPALAAGNCVVLKAPELAPYTVMRLAELFAEAGFPPGVVNLVVGGADIGEAMVSHPGIDKIQFVGSGATAKKVLVNAAATLKPCGLELGGKSAVVVFADADLQHAAQKALSGAISASGQGCVNGTRLLVERPIYDTFIGMLEAMAGYIPIGDPLDANTVIGPLISEGAVTRISGVIERAQSDGARLVVGGQRIAGEHAEGYYLPITLIADVNNDSDLAQNEVFGPVLAIVPFDTEDEAIELANGTDYGLGAYVHTENLGRAHRMASQLQAGMIHVNGSGEAMQPFAPFGGMKQSGYGRLGGEQGLKEFLQTKNVWINTARRDGEVR